MKQLLAHCNLLDTLYLSLEEITRCSAVREVLITVHFFKQYCRSTSGTPLRLHRVFLLSSEQSNHPVSYGVLASFLVSAAEAPQVVPSFSHILLKISTNCRCQKVLPINRICLNYLEI